MPKGTVKWFNPTKGFGFIVPEEGNGDMFVHITALEKAGISELHEGQVVTYEVATNKGKTSAVHLKIIK
jgi:CspA family cold shock protein